MTKKTVYNIQTKDFEVKDLTSKDIHQIKERQAQAESEQLEARAKAEEKQAKLESAKAKLTALGLDEAEVKAILGL